MFVASSSHSTRVVVSSASPPSPSLPAESTAAKLLSLLQPGGALELTLTQNSESQFKELSSALLFSGFTLEERVPEKGVLVAKKPNWDSETVGVNIAGNKENGGEQAASAADAWGVSAVRAGKGDVVSLDDLLDEDELLAESEEVFREKIEEANKAAQECGEDGVMRRRACKNCHCGRAEMLEVGFRLLDGLDFFFAGLLIRLCYLAQWTLPLSLFFFSSCSSVLRLRRTVLQRGRRRVSLSPMVQSG